MTSGDAQMVERGWGADARGRGSGSGFGKQGDVLVGPQALGVGRGGNGHVLDPGLPAVVDVDRQQGKPEGLTQQGPGDGFVTDGGFAVHGQQEKEGSAVVVVIIEIIGHISYVEISVGELSQRYKHLVEEIGCFGIQTAVDDDGVPVA